MAVVTICSDSGSQENQICHYFHFFPIYLPWTDGTGCYDLNFYFNVEFQASFSLPSFTFIFSSSTLFAIWVISSVYLRLLIFLLAIMISACGSSNPAFHVMYSAEKLDKQADNIQLCCTLFPTLNQSVVACSVLLLLDCIQVSRETGKVVWYSHLFKSFPQFVVIHTIKGFSVVKKVEVDGF